LKVEIRQFALPRKTTVPFLNIVILSKQPKFIVGVFRRPLNNRLAFDRLRYQLSQALQRAHRSGVPPEASPKRNFSKWPGTVGEESWERWFEGKVLGVVGIRPLSEWW